MAIPLVLIASFLLVSLGLFLLIRREIATAKESTLDALRDMMRKGHRYSDPSGAAVVTPSPEPAPVRMGEPSPVAVEGSARSGLLLPAPSTARMQSGPRPVDSGMAERTELRRRAEAEEDARERARKARTDKAALEAAARAVATIDGADVDEARATVEVPADKRAPMASDEDSADEETHVFGASDRRTLFGMIRDPLAGVEWEQPVSSPTRAAQDFARRHAGDRITPTQPSPAPRVAGHCGGPECFRDDGGAVDACACSCDPCDAAWCALMAEQEAADRAREARETASVPPPVRFDERIARRWRELVEEARASGKARHCGGIECAGNAGGLADCACRCREGCGMIADLYAQAEREARR